MITTIGGAPAADRLAGLMRLASGTTQWKQARALEEISTCEKGVAVPLVVDDGSGPQHRSVPCDTRQRPAEKRPQPVTELSTGVWYVDLTRAAVADLTPVMEKLAGAAGVVFDLRGYPTEAGVQMLTHLIDAPENDRWMHVPKIVGPFGQTAGSLSVGWDLKPASPHFSGRIAFMTDGRAISYAESVIGYVADRKLGTIVGGTTAGTNGNVVRFVLPGEFAVTFTGDARDSPRRQDALPPRRHSSGCAGRADDRRCSRRTRRSAGQSTRGGPAAPAPALAGEFEKSGVSFTGLLAFRLEQPRHHVGHVLPPQRPHVSHVRHFLLGELHVLRLQPVLELTIDADQAVGRAAHDPQHANLRIGFGVERRKHLGKQAASIVESPARARVRRVRGRPRGCAACGSRSAAGAAGFGDIVTRR